MLNQEFEIFSFFSNLDLMHEGFEAGMNGVVVDLETKGKHNRQSLYNTQINEHNLDDLKRIREATSSRIICRINGGKFLSEKEISDVIDAGADEILVPMVKTIQEIEFVSILSQGHIDTSIMIETNEAINLSREIDAYPIYRVFVGLNDLSIARKQKNLFLPLVDGTVDYIRSNIKTRFGVAGLTHPESGYPIPCKMLINKMKRLKCTFGFARRSFFSDLKYYSQIEIIDTLKKELSKPDDDLYSEKEFRKSVLKASQILI